MGNSYNQLTLDERYQIKALSELNYSASPVGWGKQREPQQNSFVSYPPLGFIPHPNLPIKPISPLNRRCAVRFCFLWQQFGFVFQDSQGFYQTLTRVFGVNDFIQ